MVLGGLLTWARGCGRGILRRFGDRMSLGADPTSSINYVIHLTNRRFADASLVGIPLTVRRRCGSGRVGGFVALKKILRENDNVTSF